MKKTIRILSLLLAVVALFSFVSCGKTELTKKFTRGTVSGDVYTSTFGEFSFTKPADWKFMTDEEIAAAQGIAAEVFDEEKFAEQEEGTVIDMFAQSTASSDNFSISFSKGSAFTDLEKTFTASVDMVKSTYEKINWTVDVGNTETITLAGREWRKVAITVSNGAASMIQYLYFCQIGVYICSATGTTLNTYTAEQFEAMFAKVERENA